MATGTHRRDTNCNLQGADEEGVEEVVVNIREQRKPWLWWGI
jgi:hypothetical protein